MKIFESNIINTYGAEGQKWLTDLPCMVYDLALRWQLSDLEPIKNLSYNYVLSGLQKRNPIVLKLGLDVSGLNTEAAALKAFKGHGAVEILNQTDGALLLERATSGHSLKQFFPKQDNQAITITSEVIRKLHHSPKTNINDFPAINDWLIALNTDYELLKQHLPKARMLRDELLNTIKNPILLHGDLHHDNILAHDNEWKVIDPKGVIGELAYEVGCFVRNPLHELPNHNDCLNIITNRINQLSGNLELDPNRIVKWCYVQTVLAVVWALEDHIDYEDSLKTLSYFDLLLK